MAWNVFDAIVNGAKGGAKTSKAKKEAARRNGASSGSGRPRESTLAEFIMRRRLTKAEHEAVREGYVNLSLAEKDIFIKMFELPLPQKVKDTGSYYLNPATKDGVRPTKLNKRRRYILNKVRFVARFHMRSR